MVIRVGRDRGQISGFAQLGAFGGRASTLAGRRRRRGVQGGVGRQPGGEAPPGRQGTPQLGPVGGIGDQVDPSRVHGPGEDAGHRPGQLRLGGPPLGLVEAKQEREEHRPNRLHLDLRPLDQAAEVLRLEGLGARRVDVGQPDDVSWVVMADPDGNEFCVLRPLNRHEKD